MKCPLCDHPVELTITTIGYSQFQYACTGCEAHSTKQPSILLARRDFKLATDEQELRNATSKNH